MGILRRFTPLVQPISIDEAFLDVTGSRAAVRRWRGDRAADQGGGPGGARADGVGRGGVDEARRQDRQRPAEARRAGRRRAGHGGDDSSLPSRSRGCGASAPSTAAALRDFNVATIGDLQVLDRSALVRRFGKHGASLVDRAHGRRSRPGRRSRTRRSRSATSTTFDEDTSDPEVLERTLLAMSEGVSGRLRHAGLKAGTITVKVRDAGFNTITRQRGLPEPTDMTEPIWRLAVELARPEMRGQADPPAGRRGVGVRGARAARPVRGRGRARRRKAVEAADEVRERFGTRAITRARLLRTGIPAPFERDFGTAVERRGDLAEDVERTGRKRRKGRDSQADTAAQEDALDDEGRVLTSNTRSI